MSQVNHGYVLEQLRESRRRAAAHLGARTRRSRLVLVDPSARLLRMPPASVLPEPFVDTPEDRVADPQPTGSALVWLASLMGLVALVAGVIYGIGRLVVWLG